MSLLKAIKAQLGLSNTPANNFTITAEADNGTLKLARGNAGATTQDILTVNASGLVGFPVSKAIETPVKDALNATGSAPVYACRAWVNFNGTGTVAIRASGNVSSITDNGVGNYRVNFVDAMPDSNYAVSAFISNDTYQWRVANIENTGSVATTSSALLVAGNGAGNFTSQDPTIVTASFFR